MINKALNDSVPIISKPKIRFTVPIIMAIFFVINPEAIGLYFLKG